MSIRYKNCPDNYVIKLLATYATDYYTDKMLHGTIKNKKVIKHFSSLYNVHPAFQGECVDGLKRTLSLYSLDEHIIRDTLSGSIDKTKKCFPFWDTKCQGPITITIKEYV